MKGKKILAIETSSELCSAAISFDTDKYDERNTMIKHVHSERLIPMIEELLRDNNLTASELYCIAVSMGPGSFTGLRIGLTAAKGLAFSAGLPVVPVPTFDALVLEISEYCDGNKKIYVVNNANVEECYVGEYHFEEGVIKRNGEITLEKKVSLPQKFVDKPIIFGNFNDVDGIRNVGSPRATSIAKWTYLFGEDLLTFDYDYLEPYYLKNFKIGIKK